MSLLRKGGSWLKSLTIDPFETALANNLWASTFVQNSGVFNAKWRQSSNNNTASITFAPRDLAAGTWSFVLQHRAEPDAGIYTVAVSTDNVNWTTIATIDGYSAAAVATRSEVTGIALAAGTYYLNITMATKNASSTGFYGLISGIALVKTA